MSEAYNNPSVKKVREALKSPVEVDIRTLNEKLEEDCAHQVYEDIIEELEEKGVIENIREDLIGLEKVPEGFKEENSKYGSYIKHRTVGEGFVKPPKKKPDNLFEIAEAVMDYLMCVGYGFHFDGERIYDYEEDYKSFLESVLSISGLEDHQLEVKNIDKNIKILLRVKGNTYSTKFEQNRDWVNNNALKPIVKALADLTDEKIVYRGANEGMVLLLESKDVEILNSILDLIYFEDAIL